MSEEREPPSLQDTSERSALPLPLPDSDAGDLGDPPSREERSGSEPPVSPAVAGVVAGSAAADCGCGCGRGLAGRSPRAAFVVEAEPPVVEPEPEAPEPLPEPEPEPEPGPQPEPEVDPAFVPPAAQAFAGAEPAGGDGHPELLVGAAFVGGVALAFLVKRLGS